MYKQIFPIVDNNAFNDDIINLARGFFEVERILCRDFKRFNLIVASPIGSHFSSSNDNLELIKYIEKHQNLQRSIGKYDYDITYKLCSEKSKRNNRDSFFMYINLRGEDETYRGMTIKKDNFVCWSE